MWVMRRREPNDGEHWVIVVLVFVEKSKSIIHCDDRPLPLAVFDLAIATKEWIVVEKIQANDPFVESHSRWIATRIGLAGAQVDFSKNPGHVAGVLQRFGNRLFMGTHVSTVISHLRSYRMPPCNTLARVGEQTGAAA